jgi:glycoside/pentoside/hexuronide:cation symporter, GPH family
LHTLRAVSNGDAFSYAMGSFGTGVFTTVPSVLLLYYCTETLLIAPALVAAIMLFPKLWSIIWDPLVGNRSDRSSHPWGRRRPFMAAGVIGMSAAFILLFNGPVLGSTATALWAGSSYFALATLFSLYAVPYMAIPSEVSPDQAGVARLISWRMMVGMIGVLAGAAGAPLLIETGGGGRAGYGFMGWVIGGTCLAVMAIPLLMMSGRDRPASPEMLARAGKMSLSRDMREVLLNRDFRNLAITYLFQATAFSVFSAIIPDVVTRGLGKSDSYIGSALGIYLVSTIVAVPIWSALGKRYGLKRALPWAALGYGAGACMIELLVLLKADWGTALIGLAFAGIPFAGLQVLPFTVVGDLMRESGVDAKGRFTVFGQQRKNLVSLSVRLGTVSNFVCGRA